MMTLGPTKPRNATSWDENGKSQVVQILISHREGRIDSIQFVYAGKDGVHYSQKFGQTSCYNFNTVTFNYPSEYLVSVSGRYFHERLGSISFGTNKRKYGPFGTNDGTTTSVITKDSYKFNYEFGPKSCFGGFHGSVYYGCVYTIGVYVNPIKSVDELTV